jgi:hypothetical protein
MTKLSHLLASAALGCLSIAPAFAEDMSTEPAAEPAAEAADAAAEPKETETAQPPAASEAAGLAKQLANPIASLTSVPFQMNMDFGIGLDNEGVKSTLNIQPVIPVSISAGANMISRTIVPVINLNEDVALDATFGLGDITQSFFFSPKKPTKGGIVWGAGPVLLLPTATNDLLGGGKWGIGPTFVVLKQAKGWTVGLLANQIWSVAGKNDREDISAAYMQPFVNHTWPNTVGVTLNLESTYNWKAKQWTIPMNLGVSKIVRLGKQLASIQGGVRYYFERPEFGPRWGLRSTFTLLFPKRPKR